MSGFAENDIAAQETEKAMAELCRNLKPYMPQIETGVYNRIFSAIYKDKQEIEMLSSKGKYSEEDMIAAFECQSEKSGISFEEWIKDYSNK